MKAIFRQAGDRIDYTPGADVAAGDVVILGDRLVAIAALDIPAGRLGALCVRGGFDVVKDDSDVAEGDAIYWDGDGDPVGGTAGSGAFSKNPALGPFAGWAAHDAGPTVGRVRLLLESVDDQAAVARSALVQDDLAVYGLEIGTWLATDTGLGQLGASAGTPAGAFGVTPGTHGSAGPKIVSEAASGASVTNKTRRLFTLPPEYVAGQTVTLRVRCKEGVGAATVSTSIDAEVFKLDKDGGLDGSPTDLCATAAQDVTTSAANKDFTITPTGLAPGDVLDIELTGVANDTGGSVGTVLEIYDVALLLDIKG